MFRRHSGRALLSDASDVSSLGVTSSVSVSAARFSRGPQYPHWAACFNSSRVSPSGSRPAATSSHLLSATQSGHRRTLLGTPIFEISLCTDCASATCGCRSGKTQRDVGPPAGPAPRVAPHPPTLTASDKTSPSSSSLSRCLSNGRVKPSFLFNTIVRGEILFRQAAMIMKLEIARLQPAPGWRV